MKKATMSYVIACWKKGVPHGIQVHKDGFKLVPLDTQTNVSKLFNNPHRTQMQKFINWIKANETELKHEDFSIQDYGRFRR